MSITVIIVGLLFVVFYGFIVFGIIKYGPVWGMPKRTIVLASMFYLFCCGSHIMDAVYYWTPIPVPELVWNICKLGLLPLLLYQIIKVDSQLWKTPTQVTTSTAHLVKLAEELDTEPSSKTLKDFAAELREIAGK